jgi:hypothetical protein
MSSVSNDVYVVSKYLPGRLFSLGAATKVMLGTWSRTAQVSRLRASGTFGPGDQPEQARGWCADAEVEGADPQWIP